MTFRSVTMFVALLLLFGALPNAVKAQNVTIPDDSLRARIEGVLGKSSGAAITQAEMASMDTLRAFGADIADLTGLEYATGLEGLYLGNNDISDISPLVANTGLSGGSEGVDEIYLIGNPLSAEARDTDIPAIRGRGANVVFLPVATLMLSRSSIDESGPNNQATVTVTLTVEPLAPTSVATTITVSAAPGANTGPGDFTLSNNRELVIAASTTTSTGTVTIAAVDNAVSAAAHKTIAVSATVQRPADVLFNNGVTPPLPVTLTILDDEPPYVTLALSRSTIDESGPNNQTAVTATLNRASSAATTITVSAAPGENAVAGDFTLSNNKVLIIAAGETTSTGAVTIAAVDNAVRAADKTVTVSATAQNSDGITAPPDVTLTIAEDDAIVTDEVRTPPTFTDAVDFQRYRQGSPIPPLVFPAVSGGRGILTYALTPPPGLTYTPPSEGDMHSGVMSGTPTEPKGKTLYALTATDEDRERAQAFFYIVVTVDRMPSFGDTIAAQRHLQNREIEAITLPRATGGDGVLTYALTPDLPSGLRFDTETWMLSGTPLEAMAETPYALTATDEDGDVAALTFDLSVAADLMPSFGDSTVAAQHYMIGDDYRVILPEATGGDGTLAYILLPYLPEGLSFDHETRVLSGTPLEVMAETEYALSAVDADGDVASLVFPLEVRLPSPDFNRDGRVNFADFILFVGKYAKRRGGEGYDPRCDLNADGAVDFADFRIFENSYNTSL